MSAPEQPRGWWRRNRTAVVALPFLLVLAFAANGQRAVQYWWPAEAHEKVEPAADGSVTLRNTGRDGNGEHERTMTVQVLSTVPTTTAEQYPGDELQELDVPADLRVWKITVHVTAPPDDQLTGCQARVLDAAGREYDTGVGVVSEDGPNNLSYVCVPADDPGPQLAVVAGPVRLDTGLDSDDEPRPPEYDQYVYVVMPRDVEPDRLRFFFELPVYAELALSPTTD